MRKGAVIMLYKTINLKKLLLSAAFPVGVGILAAFVGGRAQYSGLAKPPLAVPGWLFLVAGILFYCLIGAAAYFVSYRADPAAMRCYYVQLAVGFLWQILFFRFLMFKTALFVVTVLLALVFLNTTLFFKSEKTAGVLFAPYLLWTAYLFYLNIGIAVLR